ncbi:hypothetical protein K438DRAFT_1934668 [Mycena galopus ATCC 62051]|nr:hypothetical protein K438DRAFT_1934668 [Mycena galopus ATCC 62051]
MLLHLPVEVLQEIGRQVPKAGNKNLRAVCKDLALAVDSQVFATIMLATNKLSLDDNRSVLETLAARELVTDWSRFPRTLKIDLDNTTKIQSEDQPLGPAEEVLFSALCCMPNIRTVIWNICWGYPEWPRTVISRFLNSQNLIDEIEIRISTRVDLNCSWEQVRGLRTLKLYASYGTPPTLYSELTSLAVNNHTLQTLHLLAPAPWSELWVTLRAQQIHLSDVATKNVTDEFLGYLGSYSGLQRLTLQYPGAGSETESDRLADIFFDSVLPRHTDSLQYLTCAARFEGRWSFGTHNAGVISRLHRLSQLDVSVNAIDVPYENSDYSGINAVENLLQIATEIPPLRSLRILAADPEDYRGSFSGNHHHNRAVSDGILGAMRSFGAQVSSPSIVVAGFMRKSYHLTATSDPNIPFKYCRP